MPFLSPAKILVILVVALIVLGPDKLPKVAKQLGSLWGDFRRFREKIESDVRGSFPDLPSTDKIAQAVRSPLSFLDNLADIHGTNDEPTSESAAGSEPSGAPSVQTQLSSDSDPPVYTIGDEVVKSDGPVFSGVTIAENGTVSHLVRSSGVVVPDEPGMN